MDITIHPTPLRGQITVIPSKSQAHRLLICAAFADGPTELVCPDSNRDIDATADCLRALGARITRTSEGFQVRPVTNTPRSAVLPCGESGSTLRFLLPIVGALGVETIFKMEGRLSQRPLSPLWEEMERMGCQFTWTGPDELLLKGRLIPGQYIIDGGVSSQFITGLLFAASLMDGESHIQITGKTESRPYIHMTRQAMDLFGVDTQDYHVTGGRKYCSPGNVTVEGDWSNGAFFLAANALGSDLTILGLEPDSTQGDRAVAQIIPRLQTSCPTVSARDIPDLVPILSVVAGANHGAVFTDIQRLRIKESDRVLSTVAMLNELGIEAEADESTLTVHPGTIRGGTVDAVNDHRIAMAAAMASTVASGPVGILGAQCVNKSYPRFWEEYHRLGGQYEQHIR